MSLRILQICCAPGVGRLGLAERLACWPTLADVAQAASRAGAEVTVLLDGPADESLSRAGVDFHQVAGLTRPSLRPPFRLRAAALARRHAPDVIHMVGLESPFVTRALCATGIPVFAQDHASAPKQRGAPLWRWGLSGLRGVAFTARAQAEPFLRADQVPARARVFAIPESSSRFTPGPPEAARALSGVHGAPALLWVGHLNANKNPLAVLCAVQRVSARLPGVTLWCAFGKAPLLPEIRALLDADSDLRGRVHLLGPVPHAGMETLYRASDAFVSASRREGSGYALIEALACGIPAIVTDIPSFRELTGGGAAGALVPDDDAEAMAEAILRAFAGESRLSEARRREVRRHFDAHLCFDVIGTKLVQAYAALAGAERDACA